MGYGTSKSGWKSEQIRYSTQGLPTEWTHRHPGPRRKNLVPKHQSQATIESPQPLRPCVVPSSSIGRNKKKGTHGAT